MSETWENIRARILARDHYLCSGRFLGGECSAVLDVHHILPRDEGGTDEEDNLMTLCHRHHPMLEAMRRAILAKREPHYKRCRFHHHTREAREACERRLNRGLAHTA